jgi:hypothetical protein
VAHAACAGLIAAAPPSGNAPPGPRILDRTTVPASEAP